MCPFRAACKMVRLVENLAKHLFPKTTGVKRPALSRGGGRATAMGRRKPLQSIPASQEARSICLGRSEPRLPSRLCGKNTLAVLRRSRPFSPAKHLFPKTTGVKRPALSWGCGGDASPHISVCLCIPWLKKLWIFFMLMWRGFAGYLVALRGVGWVVGGIFGSFFLV